MTQEAKDRTRKIVLELDDLDYDCLQKEVARYQSQTRAPANGPDEPGGVILPDGKSNLVGAVVCELVRDLIDYRDLNGTDTREWYDRWRLERADVAEAQEKITALESELAALRQVVADVETCRDHGHGITVYCDDDHVFESTHHSAVILLTDNIRVPFYAPTWQAALHAAAEHVRREATANDPSTGRE